MARSDVTVDYSRKLCEESRVLRDESKTAVGQTKAAVARSRRIRAQIQEQQKLKKP